MKPYFIDTEIYFQGEKQPPCKVYCHLLEIKDDKAKFYDDNGNSYTLPAERIMYEN